MRQLWRRLWYLSRQQQIERELAEEMDFHRSMSGARAFGNTTLAWEDSRAVWIWPWLESIWQDAVYAARNLRRQPGFAIVVILVLGTVIGLHATLATVIAGVLLRPWPGIQDPSRVVTMYLVGSSGRFGGFHDDDYRLVAERTRSLTGVAASSPVEMLVGTAPGAESARSTGGLLVTGNFFDLLGVRMATGRTFLADEDRIGAPQAVVILGYDLWRARFGGDPSTVGRTIRIDDAMFTVVGVTSREFSGAEPAWGKGVFVPLAAASLLRPPGQPTPPAGAVEKGGASAGPPDQGATEPGGRILDLVGRVAPGATRAGLQAELRVLAGELRARFSEKARDVIVTDTAFASHPSRRNAAQPVIAAALISAGLILVWLTACANVGNLLLARAAARVREIGIRLSLGASRRRIVRQLLTEGFVIALGASAVGVAIAYQLPFVVLHALGGNDASFPFRVTVDAVVLGYAVLLAALSALAFGLAPALHATRADVASALNLREGLPRSRFALRAALLGVQVALSVTLLVSAALLVRGAERHSATFDPGFAVDGVSVVEIELPPGAYDDARRKAFVADLTQVLRGVPAGIIESFGLATWEPTFIARGYRTSVRLPSAEHQTARDVMFVEVSPGYLKTLRIPIVAGRDFTAADADKPVAVINQAMARQYWPNENPVGRTFFDYSIEREIVGVMRDAHTHSLYEVRPMYYQPLRSARPVPKLLVRGLGAGRTADLANRIERIDPRLRVQITPLSANLDARLREARIGPLLAGTLGGFALGLSTIGMFGVFAYAVRQRTREIGIRLALGAPPAAVVRLLLAGHSRAVAIGLGAGLVGALLSSVVLRSRLHGVGPFDPLAYVAVAALLGAAGLVASIVPARRAVRIDPVVALREE